MVLLSALIILLIGCKTEPPVPNFPYKPEVNVFALLILNNQQKIVRVERTYKSTDYFPDDRGIADALVTISTEQNTVRFEHRFKGIYYDAQKQLQLQEGQAYHLQVVLNDGATISADCVMPGKPKIESPTDRSIVKAYRFLDIEWLQAQFAYRYLVYVKDILDEFSTFVYADSTALTFYPFLFAPPDIYVIKVVATDQNYYDYIRSHPNRDPILHISNGQGVFGAVAYDEIVVFAR